MGKPDQESAAAEEARRATGDAAGRGRGGRLSARRKRETVLRLLRGEDLESVSRELGITAARAAQWRDQFLAAGQASLKSRAPDAWDEANRRLQAKIEGRWQFGNQRSLRSIFAGAPSDGIVCHPSALGAELFLWALGHGNVPLEHLLSGTLDATIEGLPDGVPGAIAVKT